MRRIGLLLGIALVGAILFACAPKIAPVPPVEEKPSAVAAPLAKEGWEAEWEKTLAKAKEEGRVIIYTDVSPITRTEITKAFEKRYEGIVLEFVVGRGAELSQKIFTQRKAGLYLVDLYISGATTMVTALKPAGVFDPFEPVLILPQVKDPKVWWQGRLPFNKERTIFTFIATPGGKENLAVNNEVIKPEEIRSYYDLLRPKFKDKIVMRDPTIAGKPQRQVVVFATQTVLGWDYFKELVKQRTVLTRDARLQIEWIAQKKYLVGLYPDTGIALEFMEAGIPIEAFSISQEDIPWIASSFGNIALINKAPHPNAAKIFVNWLLDKEGQDIWEETTLAQSARVDIEPVNMIKAKKEVREAGVSYFMSETEEELLKYPEWTKLMQEIFAPLIR